VSDMEVELLEEEWDEDFRPPRDKHYSVAASQRIDRDDPARVVTVDRGRVTVLLDGEVVEASYAGSMRGTRVVVGDHVRVRPARHDTDVARVTALLERTSVMQRTSDDAVEEARIVAANVDQVVVVLAGDHLEAGTRFLDRVLVAAEVGGVDGVVCINKLDVADPAHVTAVRELYEGIGYTTLATSAETGEGVERLRWQLEGAWTVLTGHSGVGKSSLYNLLVPDADQAVAEVGRRGGRHTTVAAKAEQVAGLEDGWVVDTPGVRSFGVGFVAEEQLGSAFPELRELGCGHQDCRHDGEPGCRLDRAQISQPRLAAYRRLLSSVRGDDAWERDEWGSEPGEVGQ
jgi:ribosome biogenesis GTPase / thiamine phosphate phosphatase